MRIGVIISNERRVNEEIRVPQVRLIGQNGEQRILPTQTALNLAKEVNLDLVEVAPDAKPPVVKLINLGKAKYDENKKGKTGHKQNKVETKEIRFSAKTEEHDLETRKKNLIKFLTQGNKVKVSIKLRGREQQQSRVALNIETLMQLAEEMEEYGVLESRPKQESRNFITMTIAPKGKKVQTVSDQRRHGEQKKNERLARQARQAERSAAKREAQAKAVAEAKSAISNATSNKKHTNKEGSNAEDEN